MSRRRNPWIGVLLAAAAFGTAAAGSLDPPGPPAPTMKPLDQVEPRTPILAAQLPLTISQPGSYYLAGNVSAAGGGITVDSDFVTVDLEGFRLQGGTGKGIQVTCCGRQGIAVRNGTVSGWPGGGVDLVYAASAVVENVAAVTNGSIGIDAGPYGRVTRCSASGNAADGIHVGPHGTVEHSSANSNNAAGIRTEYGAVIEGSTAAFNHADGISASGAVVKDSAATNNTGIGINVSYASVVTGCTSSSNDSHGIQAQNASRVEGNTVYQNGLDGIVVLYTSVVARNVCDANGRLGDGAGIRVAYTFGSRVEGNNVTGNDRGIYVTGPSNIIVGNTAHLNTVQYDIGAGNAVGTIVSSPAGAGPWDNFDF